MSPEEKVKSFSWFQQVLDKSINGIKIKVTDDNKIEDSEL
jgi:hypothetical protein